MGRREVAIATVRSLPTPSFRVLSEHVTHQLRRVILSGRVRPGDRLVEQELANELNVSRAPVREALRALAREGLVTIVPHRGAVMADLTPELVVDAFCVRAALEGMAARLATPWLAADDLARLEELVARMEEAGRTGDAARLVEQDVEFHRVLTAACRRPVLLEALAAIANRTHFLVSATRYAYPLGRLAGLHAWIVEAVRSGDPDRVEAAVRDHILYGQQVLLRSLRGGAAGPADPPTSQLPPRDVRSDRVGAAGSLAGD